MAKVRKQVSRCIDSLGGGSGHLAAYTMDSDMFRITQVENMGEGVTKYSFEVDAVYESEFMIYEEDGGVVDDPFSGASTEHLEGYIALDENYDLARDENGKVIFRPWHYVDPTDF